MATLSLDDFKKGLASATSKLQGNEIVKATQEDAEFLKLKINESFDANASGTPIYGYYLEGSGNVLPNFKTMAYYGTYMKSWKKPLIRTSTSNNYVQLDIIGTDAKILEYGLSPVATPVLYWVNNSDEGKASAHNSSGGGNWFEAIARATGNADPLVSYGNAGSRFFAKYSIPTMFVRKGCKAFENAIKNSDTSVKLSPGGIKAIIEKELKK